MFQIIPISKYKRNIHSVHWFC